MNLRTPSQTLLALGALILTSLPLSAQPRTAEEILPGDTLAVVTVPDWAKLCDIQGRSAMRGLWEDPSMKPFREHFLAQWSAEVVEPLEAELGVTFEDYRGLLQGQLTLAMIQNEWQGEDDGAPGMVILMDSKARADQLSTNLAALRRKWLENDRPIRTEDVRGAEFSVIQLTTNDLPDTLRKFMPGASDVREATGPEDEAAAPEDKPDELFIGQSGSILIIADQLTTVQKIMNRLTGGSLPPLAEQEQFVQDRNRLFRDAHSYGWANTRTLMELLERNLTRAAENREENAPDPFARVKPDRVIAATGLGGLHSAAFAYTESPAGSEVTLFLGVPESERTGIFKVLAGEPKDTLPPPFVPADVTEFQRWRLDGQKAYDTLERMLEEISPQMLNGWNFMLNTATLAAKEEDPGFDLRQQLMGNLGDDLITYKRASGSGDGAVGAEPSTLFLLGARNGEQVAAALKMVLGLFLQGTTPATREFLGTTINTFTLPGAAMSMDPETPSRSFSMAVSRGYVAFSSDTAILEDFLRTADNPVKPLRQMPGFMESTEAVSRPGTSLLSFEDQQEAMRLLFDAFRQISTNTTPELQDPMTPIPESLGVGMPRNGLTDWFDFSLLPPFEQVEKYFYHTVYGGGGTVEGLTMRAFSPTPPRLRTDAKPESESESGSESGADAPSEH